MSDSNIGPVDSPENDYIDQSNFELSDFLTFDELEDDLASMVFEPNQNPVHQANEVNISGGTSSHLEGSSSSKQSHSIGEGESGRDKKEGKERFAFKTKSEVEVLDDGFKWRKYGKKMVKNSPNPRNYYRCSVEGCPVKKRVERDREDPSYVITTYEGFHNHQSTA